MKKNIKRLLIPIALIIAACSYYYYFKNIPLIRTPNECEITDIQYNDGEDLKEINYDSSKVISLLSKCSKRRTLDKAYTPIINDVGGYVIILYDNGHFLHIRLGDNNVCNYADGTIYKIFYQGNLKKELEKVLY